MTLGKSVGDVGDGFTGCVGQGVFDCVGLELGLIVGGSGRMKEGSAADDRKEQDDGGENDQGGLA